MELEELSARLSDLERSRDEEREKRREQEFMDKFGGRISNNKSLGLVILNELSRRNIDTSAADDAVQEILDNLRMEATALLDAIKDLADKVEDTAEAVSDAAEKTGSDHSEPTEKVKQDLQNMGAPMPDEGAGAPPPDQMSPPDMGAGAPPPDQMPPPDMGAGAPPPDQMPPPDMGAGAPPPDQMPPDQALSDRRFKNIQNIVSDRRMKRIKKPASISLSDFISACKGDI